MGYTMRTKFVMFLIGLGIAFFTTFSVLGGLRAVDEKRQEVEEAAKEVAEVQRALRKYNDIKDDYDIYNEDFIQFNPVIVSLIDRNEINRIVETYVPEKCSILALELHDNTLNIHLSNMTLKEASALTSALNNKESSIVRKVDVGNAEEINGVSVVTVKITFGERDNEQDI
jgi:uncharacterized membrane protein YgaE (UPF0421/DUF939 family)